ncbi:hypothetical protein KJ780_03250 [Candidatus Micrarchaeota archaeon]|nr:hypothetical protein [Candidatus Micrarchaeota archaeon]
MTEPAMKQRVEITEKQKRLIQVMSSISPEIFANFNAMEMEQWLAGKNNKLGTFIINDLMERGASEKSAKNIEQLLRTRINAVFKEGSVHEQEILKDLGTIIANRRSKIYGMNDKIGANSLERSLLLLFHLGIKPEKALGKQEMFKLLREERVQYAVLLKTSALIAYANTIMTNMRKAGDEKGALAYFDELMTKGLNASKKLLAKMGYQDLLEKNTGTEGLLLAYLIPRKEIDWVRNYQQDRKTEEQERTVIETKKAYEEAKDYIAKLRAEPTA